MLTQLETGPGLDIVLRLQASSTPLLDALAWLLNVIGSEIFYMAALLLVYWWFNRQLGVRSLFAFIFIALLTTAFKEVLQRPRPFMVSEQVIPLFEASGFGLPSGHVSISTAVWGYLATVFRRGWFYMVTGLLVLLMAWARMYAGVHYPQDVIVGAALGLLSLWLYFGWAGRIAAWWRQLSVTVRVAVFVVIGILVAAILARDTTGIVIAVVLIALGPAVELLKYHVDFGLEEATRKRLLRFMMGLAFIIVLLIGLRALYDTLVNGEPLDVSILRYALIFLLAASIWPWIMERAGLAEQDNEAT